MDMQKYSQQAFETFYRRVKGRLEEKLAAFNAGISSEPQPHVRQAMTEFARLNAGGKMIRGALAGLGCALFSDGPEAYSDGLSLAFEIFQTAILVHDDIIDHAALRRGQPTIPAGYTARWPRLDGAGSTANSMALCAGDMGLYLASRQLALAYGGDPCFPRLFCYYNDVILNTIRGEMIDVALPFEERHGLREDRDLHESVIEICRLKTAWYTVTGPLGAGAILGGCREEELRKLEAFGENLGVAFQIRDDILGIYGEEAALGKDVGSDAAEFKQTLLYEYTRRDSAAHRALLGYYGRPLAGRELEELRGLFRDCGALDYAREQSERYCAAAAGALEEMDFLSAEKRALLEGLMGFLREREK